MFMLGIWVIAIFVWILLVLAKTFASITKSEFLEDCPWWIILVPVWLPLGFLLVSSLGFAAFLGMLSAILS